MAQIFPTFNINPKTVSSTVLEFIKQIEAAQDKEKNSNPYSWDTFKETNLISDEMGRYLGEMHHLMSVQSDPELDSAYESIIPMLSEFSAKQGQDMELFNIYQEIQKTDLDPVQQRIMQKAIDGFSRSGLTLEEKEQNEFNEISQRLSELSNQFSLNVKNSTDAWSKHVLNEDKLEGVSDIDKSRFASQAKEKDLSGYLITLQFPDYFAIIADAIDSDLRKEMYFAYNTVASEFMNDGEFNNDETIKEILSLKHRKSRLLGFKNYAEYSLATKMADTPEQVVSFLNDLSSKSKSQSKEERVELAEYAKNSHSVNDLNHWDTPYFAKKHKEEINDIDFSKIKEYFPVSQVKSGLFWFIEEMFGFQLEVVDVPFSYNKDLELYKINKDGEGFAYIYADLYSRPGKRGGAWMNDYAHRMEDSLPIAFVVCNFPTAEDGAESLLEFGNVTTLFHEFGHALHHTLTTVKHSDAAGISGVPWDAVELPSTFMEFFCSNPKVLSKISSHYETGECLPDELVTKLKSSEQYMSATGLLRQMEMSIADMVIHMEDDKDIHDVSKDLKEEFGLKASPSNVRPFNTFQHIFAGGYSAGYYSYKWADILSSDIYEEFEENGVINKELAKKYLDELLSQGGSKDMGELFRAFKGRDPKPDAFLKYQGIKV
jgi:oligopeptidase A